MKWCFCLALLGCSSDPSLHAKVADPPYVRSQPCFTKRIVEYTRADYDAVDPRLVHIPISDDPGHAPEPSDDVDASDETP